MAFHPLSRRIFVRTVATAGAGLKLGALSTLADARVGAAPAETDPLLDWSDWEKHRATVSHPCLTIKPVNLGFARENLKRYGWAKDYLARVERNNERHFQRLTPAFIESMIEETTPGDPLWTPCPACRQQGKPVHPHGLWVWAVEKPNQLQCTVCEAVFPNEAYPEDVFRESHWGNPQTFTYCGGEPFKIFGYTGRPSFKANIRSRKVQWMASYARTLGEGYLLTGKARYARACRDILLRLAACYPTWLVHVGYGEFADTDPRTAALNIGYLPEPEICPPPNEPDRALWTGYWSAGRASGVGLESDFVRKVVAAYDLTCQAVDGSNDPVYSDSEKRRVERDLLLESTILLVADKQINNKSVSNRTAAALVGMCVGHPGLVRFGLEGFDQTVNAWYLPDGTSSESPFYGLMTLGGIWDMAQAAQGYSDPPAYRDPSGARIDSLDLYHGTNYRKVWEAFFKGQQGDLSYPPYADSFRDTRLDVSYVELMVANYPECPEYLALLRVLCEQGLELHSGSATFSGNQTYDEPVLTLPYDLTKPTGAASFSFYYRRPGLENAPPQVLALPDWCPPNLRIGHLRTGEYGRESLLLLSASPWKVHRENDSLNLYYWKRGREILSDPGYLWDHPRKPQNKRTVAHNTVVLDEQDQISAGRGGEVLLFKSFGKVKVMEMASSAYPEASLYRRTSVLVDHGNGRNYVVDFFRVAGGELQDYVFHGAGTSLEVQGIAPEPAIEALYDFVNVRKANGAGVWRATWPSGSDIDCSAWAVGQPGEEVWVADGWGQRDWKNADIGATIPYVVRRCRGEGVKTFVAVFEGYEKKAPFVRNVTLIDPEGTVRIDTALGQDFVMSALDRGILRIGAQAGIEGHFAAGSVQEGKIVWCVQAP